MSQVSKLNEWIRGIGNDTALVFLIASHLDISVLSPGGSPGVLHQPVVDTVLGSITYGESSVIQAVVAGAFVEDTSSVVHHVVSVDVDRDRTNIG